jgi:hypothetical protein
MSLTSPTKPDVASFLIDPGTPYTISGNPYNEYIYATNSAVSTLNLPLANTLYKGFTIRVSNLQTGLNTVTVAKQGSDTLTGTGLIAVGAQAQFTTDGVSKWYLA